MNLWKLFSNSRALVGLVYLLLLAVLLPHTAWAFGKFQSPDSMWLAWLLAIVFELGIFIFTHNVAENIRRSVGLPIVQQFIHRYANVDALGLACTIAVSCLANFSHAVEHQSQFATYEVYGFPPLLYHLGFGAILPLMSLFFAGLLAKAGDVPAAVSVSEETAKSPEYLPPDSTANEPPPEHHTADNLLSGWKRDYRDWFDVPESEKIAMLKVVADYEPRKASETIGINLGTYLSSKKSLLNGTS